MAYKKQNKTRMTLRYVVVTSLDLYIVFKLQKRKKERKERRKEGERKGKEGKNTHTEDLPT